MPPTVLLADDDEDVRIVYSLGLQRRGFLTLLARDGEEAPRLASTLRPDALVLDIDLPHLDGDEVIRALKADPETADVAAVLITASRDAGVRARAAEAGCDAFYVKPVSPRLLADAVHGLVRGVGCEAVLAG
jgi:CheY-like chemotaxis protein